MTNLFIAPTNHKPVYCSINFLVSQACTIMAQSPSVEEYGMTNDMLAAHVRDHFAQFTLLESGLRHPNSFMQDCAYHQLTPETRKQLIHLYVLTSFTCFSFTLLHSGKVFQISKSSCHTEDHILADLFTLKSRHSSRAGFIKADMGQIPTSKPSDRKTR